tara:strand:- start:3266 stop:4219 length:954 start_codon:yes stop_codon:yes gene_type:complete
MKNILIISLFLNIALSADAKTGTSIFRWAEIQTGTRAIGMGGTQVASGNDISALPYNPASVCSVGESQLFSSVSNYLADTKHFTMAYGRKISSSDFIGVHIFVFDSGEMPEATETQELTGKQFSFQGLAARVTYGRKVTDRLNLGGTLKFLRESVTSNDLSMSGVSFDIGSNFDTGIYGLMLGMSITNFGPESKYLGDGLDVGTEGNEDEQKKTVYHPMPLTFRVGLEKVVINNEMYNLSVTADAINPLDYSLFGSVATEFVYQNLASVRLGYQLGHSTAGLSLGAGVSFKNFTLDAAYADYGILQNTVQFGLGYKF